MRFFSGWVSILTAFLVMMSLMSPGMLQAQDAGSELFLAVEQGSLKKVRALLGQGVAVDIRDDAQWTPLMRAAFNGGNCALRTTYPTPRYRWTQACLSNCCSTSNIVIGD